MPIVTSVIVTDTSQVDGRRAIHERHTDHVGVAHHRFYLAEAGADVSAAMLAQVPVLEAALVAQEQARNMASILSGENVVTADWVTVADMRQAIRTTYAAASGEQVGRLAAFLLTVSDANLQTLFGLANQAQVNQLKSRLQSRFTELQAVLTAVGE